jgi:hypothetical protein
VNLPAADKPTPEANAAAIERMIGFFKRALGVALVLAGGWATFMYWLVDDIRHTAIEAKDEVAELRTEVRVLSTKMDGQSKLESKLDVIEERLRTVEQRRPE